MSKNKSGSIAQPSCWDSPGPKSGAFRVYPVWDTWKKVTAASKWFSRTRNCAGSACSLHNLRSNRQTLQRICPVFSSLPPAPGASPQALGAFLLSAAPKFEADQGRLFFLELQLSSSFVLLEERAKLRRRLQQSDPLFVIQRDGKSPQAVHADAPFFAHSKFQRSGPAPASLFFQFRDFCFQFFVTWLGHGASCVGSS